MTILTRQEAALYLRSKGLRSSKITLAKLAMTGEGPQYALVRGTSYYRPEWLDEWLDNQLKPQTHSFAHMSQNG